LDPAPASHEWIAQKTTYRNGLLQPSGFTQGSPLSPFLSSVASLTRWVLPLPSGVSKLMYADDGLLYGSSSDESSLLSHLESTGIPVNKEKSGYIKKDGKWLKPLKFLGLVYDGNEDVLYSETRSGNRLLYDKQSLVLALISRSRSRSRGSSSHLQGAPYPLSYAKSSWVSLAESQIFGLIQSRLYSGSLKLPSTVGDFALSFLKGS